MKIIPAPLLVASLLALAASPLAAQSTGFSQNIAGSVAHSGAASEQVMLGSGEAIAAGTRVVAGVGAVAFWTGGSVAQGSGALSTALGEAGTAAGTAVTKGGTQLWDFASGDPAQRPALDRTRSVPPAPAAAIPPAAPAAPKQTVARDPAPAEMFRTASR